MRFFIAQAIILIIVIAGIIIGWKTLADRIVALEECCYHLNTQKDVLKEKIALANDTGKFALDMANTIKVQNEVLVDRISAISSRLPVKYSPPVSKSMQGVVKVRDK